MIQERLKEIIQGKNLLIYLTIACATITVTIKIFGWWKSFEIIPILLGIMSLVLVSLLRINWGVENQKELLNNLDGYIKKPNFDICNSWTENQVYRQIENAKNKIVLVQSWFPDASTLADKIVKASNHRKKSKKKLEVEIFLSSPDSIFGAQRWLEVHKKIGDISILDAQKKHLEEYNSSISNFKSRLLNLKNIKLNLYSYNTLPSLKVYSIDDKYFYFGWLGLDSNSTQNVCFFIQNEKSSKSDLAVRKIKNHLKILESESNKIK